MKPINPNETTQVTDVKRIGSPDDTRTKLNKQRKRVTRMLADILDDGSGEPQSRWKF